MLDDLDSPVQRQMQTWLSTFDAEGVSVAGSLCDRHAAKTLIKQPCAMKTHWATVPVIHLHSCVTCRPGSAGALKALGVTKGDRVATLLPKSPELLITTLGLWRLGAAHVPLFTAFGPQAITSRVKNSQASVYW